MVSEELEIELSGTQKRCQPMDIKKLRHYQSFMVLSNDLANPVGVSDGQGTNQVIMELRCQIRTLICTALSLSLLVLLHH